MISAADILARLEEQCSSLNAVESPAHLATLERPGDQLPAVTVHLVSDAPGFTALSGACQQYRRRYEIRITAADDDALAQIRVEIHDSLLLQWEQIDDDWAEYFGARRAANFIRWIGGEMVAITASAVEWRDVFELQLSDLPSADPEPAPP